MNLILKLKSKMLAASYYSVFLIICVILTAVNAEEEYQRLALHLHNEFRAAHQTGPLKSNDKLNLIAGQCAQYYANKGFCDMTCPFRSNTTEQSCYWEWRVLSNEKIVESSIDAWSSEECKHDYNKEGQPGTRNFSLMVWANSKELGFGVGRNGSLSYGCAMYSPGGNIVGLFKKNVFPSKNGTIIAKC